MSESDSIVAATAARIFSDLAEPQAVNSAKDQAWRAPLWRALTEAGLPLALAAEEHGGAGASLADGFEVLRVAGQYAVAAPLAETMLAGWLLSRAGLAAPSEAMTIAPARPGEQIALDADGVLSGRARGVPLAQDVRHIAVLAVAARGLTVALVDAAACRIGEGRNLAGDATNLVIFDGAVPGAAAAAPGDLDLDRLMLMGAVARSLQIAGAMETVLDISVRYANERVAFERPIGKFQAVQHNLARLAGETAAALTAAGSAADAIASAGPGAIDDGMFLEAASAKIRCAEAAAEGAAIAHQVHGAIGYTREHVLHRFTLRMLAWRDDFGHESHWAAELGKRVAFRGAEAFWPLVAAR